MQLVTPSTNYKGKVLKQHQQARRVDSVYAMTWPKVKTSLIAQSESPLFTRISYSSRFPILSPRNLPQVWPWRHSTFACTFQQISPISSISSVYLILFFVSHSFSSVSWSCSELLVLFSNIGNSCLYFIESSCVGSDTHSQVVICSPPFRKASF